MRRALGIAALLIASAGMTLAADFSINVSVGESTVVSFPGATAAYPLDVSIAEASVVSGGVTLVGLAGGTTQVMVVSSGGTKTIAVTVRPRVQASQSRTAAGAEHGSYELRYASAGKQVQNTVELSRVTGTRHEEVHLQTSTSSGQRAAGEPVSVIRAATYRVTTPRRELTLFDSDVDHSSLTVDGTTVRGIHLRQDGWRAHAGYTTNATFGSLLLSSQRDLVIGGGYQFRNFGRSRLMPSVFAYPTQHGSVVSLLYDYARDDVLEASAEVGYSRGLGGAGHFVFNGESNRIRADVRYQPRSFAIVGPSTLHGFYSDASWSTKAGKRFSAELAESANHYQLTHFDQWSISANGQARYALTRALAMTGGVSYGSFTGTGTAPRIRSLTIPVGLEVDSARFGGGLVYRYAVNSATNEGGHGVRATLRGRFGSIRASGYFDYQTDAPTLDLILRDDPALSLALQQLGIAATTPEDIAQALRSNAALINLGFIEGATVNLAPSRTQIGLESAWTGSGPARMQLRARLLYNETERITTRVGTTLASLTWSQRLAGSTDVYARITSARTSSGPSQGAVFRQFFELGVRQRFDSFPRFGGGSGTISGQVFLDEEMTGAPTGRGGAGIEVLLDGGRSTRSDVAGRFAFASVPPGSHRVEARVGGSWYFTTLSAVEVRPGEAVQFGIASTPAGLIGRVTDESGQPVHDVTVVIAGGARQFRGVTRNDGQYSIAAAPGEYEAAVSPESLPAGVTFSQGSVPVVLQRGTPAQSSFVVQVNRSVGGRVEGGLAGDVVTIPALRRSTPLDTAGRYLFRSLPAGEVTLVARSRGQKITRDLTLPPEPAALRDVDFGLASH